MLAVSIASVSAFVLASCTTECAAVPGVGAGTVNLTVSAMTSGPLFDDDGVADVSGDVFLQRKDVRITIDTGIGERLALRASLPLVRTAATTPSGTVDIVSLGDLGVGLSLLVVDNAPVFVAVRADAGVPLYQAAPSRRGLQNDTLSIDGRPAGAGLSPAIGDGQVDLSASLFAHATLPFAGHVWGEGGYRFRTGDVTDAIFVRGAFVVAALGDRLWLRYGHAFAFSFDAAPSEIVGKSIIETGPGASVRLDELARGLALNVDTLLLLRGRNAPGGSLLSVGVTYAF